MPFLPKTSPESETLYTDLLAAAQASDEGLKKLFYQPDIKDLADATAKSVDMLLRFIQELVSHCLLRTSRQGGALCWSTRPRAAAENIRALATNERTLYEYVEDSHTKGIWLRELKKRSGIEEKKVERAMAKLESARLVKLIKNIRAPAQKTYMLAHLVPSDDVTGGSFFDAGDLDESLIEEVGNLIVFHVRSQSWEERKVYSKRPPRAESPIYINGHGGGGEAEVGSKRKRSPDIEDMAAPHHQKPSKHRSHRRRSSPDPEPYTLQQIPHPASPPYPYPSTETIHTWLTTTSAIRQSKAQQLTLAEIQGVIDVLVWDDKLERIAGGYRTVRGVEFRPPGFGGAVGSGGGWGGYGDGDGDDEGEGEDEGEGLGATRNGNGLTQVPCGRCPVLELCGVGGGQVNAGSCVYFREWLGREV
ncbi:34-kDa subunit of RNA polymerase III (C) [Recurvomyces mirabilis]|uniref:34-kDa subunit of RNA polymerase III (C) n=1 Tax=Recurvomyces mirabilis TaxID=574656 RepID=A0AAE1C3R0_9PEZI|nr:34-kDa subunit of RNA polymerase III (C) [Recurvomyces mirabilis]KAK5154493.1 34-kDa subunit of RNA polymerase III (C) [Recurvomyces mirabilis]